MVLFEIRLLPAMATTAIPLKRNAARLMLPA
jgi:hypothetical protein